MEWQVCQYTDEDIVVAWRTFYTTLINESNLPRIRERRHGNKFSSSSRRRTSKQQQQQQ
jgi:uncharacterized protein YccT (UPF0319 family)